MKLPALDSLRNFCITAHIDHGKSTLADRLLERTGLLTARQLHAQHLDAMDLERERGITIKAKAVALPYAHAGRRYTLNLIDTPGHVDFSYEVSKSMQACEGALLLVDAAQGLQAQTLANAYLALEAGLEIVPVLNKIDLQAARPEEVAAEIEQTLGVPAAEVLAVSAKTGAGVERLLEAVIARIPAPVGDPDAPLQALVFDSVYDEYRGVVVHVRVVNGTLEPRTRVLFLRTATEYDLTEIGVFRPHMEPAPALRAGEVGYLISNIRRLGDVRVGDTVTVARGPQAVALPGFRHPQAMVFCGMYPSNPGEFEQLRQALEKLQLNDASFTFEPDTSDALGFGFRCGFLGLLHMEVVQERLERESDVDLVQTAPNVTYEVVALDGETRRITKPSHLPDTHQIAEIREPIVRLNMIIPAEHIGAMMRLCQDRRGRYEKQEYLSPRRAILTYRLPLAEILFDFYDKLKSATRGYGTMDYEVLGFEAAPLVRLHILIGGQEVDALSAIVPREQAERRGRRLLVALRKEIPRQQFEVPLQAALGARIVARETIKPFRKNVTAKCYGGDVTRKRKLLEKQKKGKKRMKSVGNVEIPQRAFMAVLTVQQEE